MCLNMSLIYKLKSKGLRGVSLSKALGKQFGSIVFKFDSTLFFDKCFSGVREIYHLYFFSVIVCIIILGAQSQTLF